MNINNIYCRHLLCNDNLKKHLTNCKHKYYYIDPHYILHIEDTIHYNALISNRFDIYNQLITDTNQHEHSNDKFKELIEDFKIYNMNPLKITYIQQISKYIIVDGVHRFALLIFNKIVDQIIPLNFLQVEICIDTINQIKEKLNKTTKKTHYNGWSNRTIYGYHSLNIHNINLIGQRKPIVRLKQIKEYVNFTNKNIIDFGCNTGGMLLHLPEIKEGYGIDYDDNCIDAANYIKNILKYNSKLYFIKHDLNTFNFDNCVNRYHINNKIDIIFLLSIGSWIKNWKDLYTSSYNNSSIIILETNNDNEGKSQLELFMKLGANIKLIIEKSLDDITNNYGRKTYLITK